MEALFEPDDWRRQTEALRRIARALVGEAHGDDVVQNAYLTVLEGRPKGITAGWLTRTVRSRALDLLRRERRRSRTLQGLAASGPHPEPEVGEKLELHRLVVEAVQGLREPYRRTVYLRYFDGLTPAEIALRVDAPVKTVKTRLHRALALLRERLDHGYGAGPGAGAQALAAAFLPRGAGGLPWAGGAALTGGLGIMAKKIGIVVVAILVVWGTSHWLSDRGEALRPQAGAPGKAADTDIEALPAREGRPALDPGGERVAAVPEGSAEPAPAPPVAPSGSVTVHVRWAQGSPAAGIGVQLRAVGAVYAGLERVISDASGTARFEGVPPGRIDVSSDWRDIDASVNVQVVAGREETVELVIPRGLAVEGQVLDGDGAPVGGAGIWLTTGHGDWLGGSEVASAGPDGRFRLRDVPRQQSLGAVAAGYAPSELVDLEAIDTSRSPVSVQLVLKDEGGALRGTVTGPGGEPVAGASVSLGAYGEGDWHSPGDWFTEAWTPRVVLTDEQGRYAMEGLEVGLQPLRVRSAGLPVWKGEVEILAGRTAHMDAVLRQGVTVAGRVTNAQGEPVAGAVVRAFDQDIPRTFLQGGQYDYEDAFFYPWATTDGEGHYVLTALPPGELFLFANPPRERGARRRSVMRAEEVLNAAPGEVLAWDPVIGPGRVIEGIVIYRDGHPMPHVFLSARNDRTGVAQSLVNGEDGRFTFYNMQDAPYVLGVQLWDAPKGAEPVQARDVYPDQGPVELVASYDRPQEQETCTVRCTLVDAGERAESPELLTVQLESDRNFARVWVEREGAGFVFPEVEPGRYRPVVLLLESPILVGDWIELEPGEDRDLGTLRTEPGASLNLLAPRPAGTEDVEIRLFLRSGGTMSSTEVKLGTDAERRIQNLTPGTYDVRAYGTGIASVFVEAEVRLGRENELSLELQPAVPCGIEITWPENEALGSLSVRVSDAAGEVVWDRTETNVAFLPRPYTLSPQFVLGNYTVVAESKSGLRGTAALVVDDLEPDPEPVGIELR